MTTQKKKSLVGWTYPDWQLRYGECNKGEFVSYITPIIKPRKWIRGKAIKVRITMEEVK